MNLKLFSDTIALCKLTGDADLNEWQGPGPLNVVINDPHGTTVICNTTFLDSKTKTAEVIDRSLWRFFQIDEIFDADSIGVVAEFSKLLAEQKISVFVISSHETDYLLVQPKDVDAAVTVFESAGHAVSHSV